MTERSTGIWVCAILFTIGGVLFILGFILFEPISIIPGVVCLAVAYGILNMKKWAKIAGIILAIICGVSWFPVGIVITLIILYFLLIEKDTKDLFIK